MNVFKKFPGKFSVALAAMLVVVSAFALDLSSAKSLGLVGETESGYLAKVSGDGEVTALVNEINAKRKAQYQNIARENGISLSNVELLAGKKAIEKTPAGQYVQVAGSWLKK